MNAKCPDCGKQSPLPAPLPVGLPASLCGLPIVYTLLCEDCQQRRDQFARLNQAKSIHEFDPEVN